MRVVHLFDQYLNNTMSWAYRLIKNTPDVKSYIAAPLILRNKYFDPEFIFVEDPFRRFLHIPKERSEWEISYFSKVWSAIALRTFFPVFVKSVIFREKIDLMHAHFAHVGVEYMRIARRYNIPLIVSFYGTDYERLPFEQPKYIKLYEELFDSATVLICEGKNGADLLQKMGCPFHKIRIVKLGIDSSSITYFTKKKKKDSLLLIQAATFTETKGFVFTISAFAEALKSCPDMTLTLVGEKWEKNYWNEVAALIMQFGLQDKIKVLDFIETDFHLFLGKFDVFIHPSCYSKVMECEGGAPIVLLDAQMVGLPVISTFHCDIPEEVINGVTGLLSNEKDINSLRENITRFYRMDDSEYQTFSQNARKHVADNYDSRKNSIALKSVYEELIS